jgi:hypothetical protein
MRKYLLAVVAIIAGAIISAKTADSREEIMDRLWCMNADTQAVLFALGGLIVILVALGLTQ